MYTYNDVIAVHDDLGHFRQGGEGPVGSRDVAGVEGGCGDSRPHGFGRRGLGCQIDDGRRGVVWLRVVWRGLRVVWHRL